MQDESQHQEPDQGLTAIIALLLAHYQERTPLPQNRFEECWREIDRIFRAQLIGYFVKRFHSFERARELASSVFTQVHRKLHLLEDPLRFRGWLFRIAYYLQTKERVFDPVSPDKNDPLFRLDDEQSDHAALVDMAMEKSRKINASDDSQEFLEKVWEHLCTKCRELLTLYHIEERPYEEIAQIFGNAKTTTVSVWVFRCLAKARRIASELQRKGI